MPHQNSVVINEPIIGLPDTSLNLLEFHTVRSIDVSTHIGLLAIYQKGPNRVSVLMQGNEPSVYLSQMMEYAAGLPNEVKFYDNWPTNICINHAIKRLARSHQITVTTMLLGVCKKCQKQE